MSEGRYHQAQICLKGHSITAFNDTSSARRKQFCDECGAATVTNCPACNSPIRGDYEVPGVVALYPYEPPAFCADCGAPLPWTQRRLDAARELAQDLDRLSPAERDQLAATLPELVRDAPMTTVAANRFKRW